MAAIAGVLRRRFGEVWLDDRNVAASPSHASWPPGSRWCRRGASVFSRPSRSTTMCASAFFAARCASDAGGAASTMSRAVSRA